MKLYLSSLRIPQPKPFLKLFGKNPLHIAIIPTAWHVLPPEKSEPFITHTTKDLVDLGFTTESLNLEDYADKPEALHAKLREFSGCWVLGGNSFYLNYWMMKSGFDNILPDLLKDGFVYGAESAGAVVVGRSLHGIELLDDPSEAPEVIWPGLGLVDYGIVPHWGHGTYAGRIEQAYDEMRLFGPVKTLANDEFIVIE
jgi:dipeptidase E